MPATTRPLAAAVLRGTRPALAALAVLGAAPLPAQTLDDGRLLPRATLGLGVEYSRESWDRYWEGALERGNANIGTLSTRATTLRAAYGVTDRLTVLAALPHVRNEASAGVLSPMAGWQDLSLAARARLLRVELGAAGTTLDATLTGGIGTPVSRYTPDFLPLSIGLGSRRAFARGGVQVSGSGGWFVAGSAGHTWRSTVRLDRDAYYTDGALVLSDEVAMPDVVDYGVTAGLARGRVTIPITLAGQRTLGGGDIRRNDMPFVSNRMDFTQLRGALLVALPGLDGTALQLGAARTLSGRNVGAATMVSGGLTTTVRLP